MARDGGGAEGGGTFCPRCRTDLDHSRLTTGHSTCPSCGGEYEATRFDPPSLAVLPRSLGEAGPAEATACAAHPGNVAVANCERCGVFMCDLCRIDADGHVLCPACFDRLSAEGALPSSRTTFRDYGRMGVTYLVLGLFLWIVAAPIAMGAVYAGFKRLGQHRQTGEGSAATAWVIIVLGLLEAVGSVLLIYYVFGRGA